MSFEAWNPFGGEKSDSLEVSKALVKFRHRLSMHSMEERRGISCSEQFQQVRGWEKSQCSVTYHMLVDLAWWILKRHVGYLWWAMVVCFPHLHGLIIVGCLWDFYLQVVMLVLETSWVLMGFRFLGLLVAGEADFWVGTWNWRMRRNYTTFRRGIWFQITAVHVIRFDIGVKWASCRKKFCLEFYLDLFRNL